MSLIDNEAEHNTTQINAEQKSNRNNDELTPTATPRATSPTKNTAFECLLGSSRYISCIAPNQKGNFIISICIDELNGWLLAGQCSGTLNAWKIPQTKEKLYNDKVFECRNLIKFEEDGIRHIYTFDNNIICIVGYRRLCILTDYDCTTEIKKKLAISDIFSYSPFTSPHMFYSTQYQNIVHIFCRSFSCALKIDLKTQRKEILKLSDNNRISLKTKVLNVNKNFAIWNTSKTKYDFYVESHNLHKNKARNQTENTSNNDDNNKIRKWINQYKAQRRRNEQNTLSKIEIRSLQNFNLVHNEDYFVPLPFNAWGFQMDNVSMTMAFVADSNVIKIVEITLDLNIMQYGLDYDKKQQKQQQTNDGNKNKLSVKGITKLDLKQQQSHSLQLTNALTLQYGVSYDGSIDTVSNNMNDDHVIDVLQNDDEQQIIETLEPLPLPKEKRAKELHSLRGHNGHILTIDYMDGIVLSIATDRRLCVWNGITGEKIATISNIPGTFIPGYPYIVKKSQNTPNKVFYTADDGIFMAVF